jgi:hypothetical protein
VVIGAVAVVMIVIGGNAVQSGSMTLGDFLMYISFTFLLAMPVIELTSIGTQITEALAGLDRIREVLAMSTEDEQDISKKPLPEIKGAIDFENVFFEYDAGVPVLKGVSFEAPPGAANLRFSFGSVSLDTVEGSATPDALQFLAAANASLCFLGEAQPEASTPSSPGDIQIEGFEK